MSSHGREAEFWLEYANLMRLGWVLIPFCCPSVSIWPLSHRPLYCFVCALYFARFHVLCLQFARVFACCAYSLHVCSRVVLTVCTCVHVLYLQFARVFTCCTYSLRVCSRVILTVCTCVHVCSRVVLTVCTCVHVLCVHVSVIGPVGK